MANWYVSSVAYTAVTQWAAVTVYTVGQYRRQLATPTVGSERVFRCTTAGSSGASEPTWNTSNNATTNDGTAVWTSITGQEAHQSAGSWTAPFARVDATISASVADDTIFVSSDHAETQSTASTIGGLSTRNLISVNRTGASLPPTSTDILSGASIATTGASTITLGSFYARGITFSAGSGSSLASITTVGSTATPTLLENCALILNNTSASSLITSTTGFRSELQLINTTITFGAAGQGVQMLQQGNFVWRDTASAVLGTAPTSLFSSSGGNRTCSILQVEGVDLSAITGTLVAASSIAGNVSLSNCRLASGVALTSGIVASLLSWVRVHNCDDSTSSRNYRFFEQYKHGDVRQETALYRSGGATDGVIAMSHRHQITATPNWSRHLVGNWVGKRWNTTGASVTLTMELICFLAAAAKDNEIWIDVDALTTAGYPLAACLKTAAADILQPGASLTASTENWASGITARANSTTYAVGDLRKVASNSGRVFVCTTGGTSSGSEPAGFATAVDGGAVTDGTAVWRAGYRHKITKAFTPQMKGMVRARLHVNIPTSANSQVASVYLDPKLTIV